MWAFYITVMLAVLAATALLCVLSLMMPYHPHTTPVIRIRRYAAPTVQFVVVPFVAVAWATAMSVVALVPIDVWTANYLTGSQKEPTQHTVEVLWSISYWCVVRKRLVACLQHTCTGRRKRSRGLSSPSCSAFPTLATLQCWASCAPALVKTCVFGSL